ncbi:MAG: M20/M25/M40 family metallo-hydrolase, partial [Candidatus Korarchaeota archaeon]|nr:M20/M25/M40 family metallo-hydrolase [Candidatus Korarchaeota archaeon]
MSLTNHERVKSILIDLVGIKSFRGREGEVVYYITDLLSRYADKVIHQPVKDCAGNVIAFLNVKDQDNLLFLAHTDTFEIYSNWTKSPWGEMEGDRLYGLGVFDDKSMLAAMMEAFITASKWDSSQGLVLAAVCDAEGFSRGTYELLRSGVLPKVSEAIVAGPTNMKLFRGAFGRFVFDVDIWGLAAPGTEEAGINAVIEAAKIILWAVDLPKVDGIGGSVAPLSIKSPELVIAHPDRCLVRLDRHYPPGNDPGVIRKKFMNHLRKTPELRARIKISLMKRPTPFMEPYELAEDDGFIKEVQAAAEEVLGRKLEVGIYRTVSDANYLHKIGDIKPVILGPVGGNHHSADEYVELPSVYEM